MFVRYCRFYNITGNTIQYSVHQCSVAVTSRNARIHAILFIYFVLFLFLFIVETTMTASLSVYVLLLCPRPVGGGGIKR